jgi:hypothetical protein
LFQSLSQDETLRRIQDRLDQGMTTAALRASRERHKAERAEHPLLAWTEAVQAEESEKDDGRTR